MSTAGLFTALVTRRGTGDVQLQAGAGLAFNSVRGATGSLSSWGEHSSSTCGYGKVQAKVVALEPATGFTFDTPCSSRLQ